MFDPNVEQISSYSKPELKLYSRQRPHYNTMIDYMYGIEEGRKSFHIAIDTSETGTGKSLVALAISRNYGIPLLVVAPSDGVVQSWKVKHSTYDKMPPLTAMTYQKFYGSVANGSSAYLKRTDTDPSVGESTPGRKRGPGTRKKTTFSPTEHLLERIRDGVIIVFDEFHAGKNIDTLNSKSMTETCKTVYEELLKMPKDSLGGYTRIMLLSATPIDTVRQAKSYYKMFSMKITNEIFTQLGTFTDGWFQEAMLSVHNFCIQYGTGDDILYIRQKLKQIGYYHDSTYHYIGELGKIKSSEAEVVAYEILLDIVFRHISSAMAPDFGKSVFRGFFNLDTTSMNGEDNTKKYSDRIEKLANDLENMRDKENKSEQHVFAIINNALKETESFIVPSMVKNTLRELNENSTCKAIVTFNIIDNLLTYVAMLEDYGKRGTMGTYTGYVAGIYGRKNVSQKNKASVTENERLRFQTDPTCRVLVMTTKSGGVGIDLHDNLPGEDAQRIMFISPEYSMIGIHQAMGRVFRSGSKTQARGYIYFGLGLEGATFDSVLKNVAKKSQVVRRATHDLGKTEDGRELRIYPGEYPMYFDGYGYTDEKKYLKYETNPKTLETTDVIVSMDPVEVYNYILEGKEYYVDPPSPIKPASKVEVHVDFDWEPDFNDPEYAKEQLLIAEKVRGFSAPPPKKHVKLSDFDPFAGSRTAQAYVLPYNKTPQFQTHYPVNFQ